MIPSDENFLTFQQGFVTTVFVELAQAGEGKNANDAQKLKLKFQNASTQTNEQC